MRKLVEDPHDEVRDDQRDVDNREAPRRYAVGEWEHFWPRRSSYAATISHPGHIRQHMLVWPRSPIVWAHSVATPQTTREAGGARRQARAAANVTTRPSLIAALITSGPYAVMPCERL